MLMIMDVLVSLRRCLVYYLNVCFHASSYIPNRKCFLCCFGVIAEDCARVWNANRVRIFSQREALNFQCGYN